MEDIKTTVGQWVKFYRHLLTHPGMQDIRCGVISLIDDIIAAMPDSSEETCSFGLESLFSLTLQHFIADHDLANRVPDMPNELFTHEMAEAALTHTAALAAGPSIEMGLN